MPRWRWWPLRADDSPHLRAAAAADRDLLLAWRNDPVVRAASRSVAVVTPEEHAAWFAGRLADPDTRIFVVEVGGVPVGQVRVDRVDGTLGEIHIALAEAARGHGLAAAVLRDAARRGGEQLGLASVEAHVRVGNQPSLRAFERAGFSELSRDDDWVVLRWALR